MNSRRLYRAWQIIIKSIFIDPLFRFWEFLGFHILEDHFYQPVPNTRALKDDVWTQKSELIGLDMNEQNQINLLKELSSYKSEYDTFPEYKTPVPWQYYCQNPNFGPVDAEVLYSMVRHIKPGKIIEIGSGQSTFLMAQAALRNEEENGCSANLVVIEPYPDKVITDGFPGLTGVIKNKVENVDLAEFSALEQNDILFIDSSHVLTIGNDVKYEYLEILPRLRPGVIIHIHDIFMPCEYPKQWVMNMHRFWNEQYLLQAFLAFNNAFELLFCSSYMHVKHPDELRQAFTSYNPQTIWLTNRPGATSLWIRKIA